MVKTALKQLFVIVLPSDVVGFAERDGLLDAVG
jgi:hypothetical protein